MVDTGYQISPRRRSGRSLLGLPSRVKAIAFSPDGKKVATEGDDKFANIWNTEIGKELYRLQHTNNVLLTSWMSELETGV